MSHWTHIIAAIDVDTYIHSDVLKEVVEKFLADAPKITGSEGDAEIFINVLSGYNVSTTCDCDRCDYNSINNPAVREHACRKLATSSCKYGEYQTRVVITIIGDLRDRQKTTTEREYLNFVRYFNNNISSTTFEIRNISCNITDE